MSLVETLGITDSQIAEFCRKWQVAELSLFGSALRGDFRPDSRGCRRGHTIGRQRLPELSASPSNLLRGSTSGGRSFWIVCQTTVKSTLS